MGSLHAIIVEIIDLIHSLASLDSGGSFAPDDQGEMVQETP